MGLYHNIMTVSSKQPESIFQEIPSHDDVIKWKYFPRYWLFVLGIHRSPVNSSHKGQWRGALMFSLICAWINCWVNNHTIWDAIALIWRYCNGISSRARQSLKERYSFVSKYCILFIKFYRERVQLYSHEVIVYWQSSKFRVDAE